MNLQQANEELISVNNQLSELRKKSKELTAELAATNDRINKLSSKSKFIAENIMDGTITAEQDPYGVDLKEGETMPEGDTLFIPNPGKEFFGDVLSEAGFEYEEGTTLVFTKGGVRYRLLNMVGKLLTLRAYN